MIGKQRKPNKSTTKPPKNEPKSHSIDTDETGGFGANSTPRIGFESSLEWDEISCLSWGEWMTRERVG